MENLVASRLFSFLDTNGILSKWQFGVRSGHSPVHPMIHFLNKISDLLNNNKHSIAIFCDFKKLSTLVIMTFYYSNFQNMGYQTLS